MRLGAPKAHGGLSRRAFLQRGALSGAAALASGGAAAAARNAALHLATNSYSWQVFYQREGKDLASNLDQAFRDIVASGINGYEPGVGGLEEIPRLLPLLEKNGLEMRSIYVGTALHDPAEAGRSIERVLAVSRQVKPFGTKIVVTNPSPLKGGQDKSDEQLRTQAASLDRLGLELGKLGLRLAYHNHNIELRQAAREFHHMMAGTDPRHVGLCLDAHWIYRGAGNSSVALFDVAALYGARVSELHLRQSREGIWSETFGPGDIDYEALARALAAKRVKPHLVLEVAVEKGTPKTLSPVEAHRESAAYARRVLAALR